jgi:Rrf2 family protein
MLLWSGMFRYGKLARQAVSAISYLAEKHSPDAAAVSSAEVGRERKIPAALAAKLLSQMATAGLTLGTTGPGGGYRLARPPEKIRLAEIVSLFERDMDEYPCPFGPGFCGSGDPCPLHDDFLRLEENGRKFLEETTLGVFAKKERAETPR